MQSNKTTKISAQPAMIAPNKQQVIPTQVIPPIGSSNIGGVDIGGGFVQKVIEKQVKKAVLDAAMNNPEALYYQQISDWKGIFSGVKGSPSQQAVFNRLFDGVTASDIVRDGKLTPEAQEYFNDYLPKKPTWLQQKMPGFFPT